jgi:hypothetical protein
LNALEVFEVVVGAAIVIATLYDLFQSVLLPRPAVARVRLSVPIYRFTWIWWRALGTRLNRVQTRETFLSTFGPLSIFLVLVLWGSALILGYGLMLHGLREGLAPQPKSLGTSLYASAQSLLTIGFGDYLPVSAGTRILVMVEAGTGLALVALVVNLLFSLFSSFHQREAVVITLDAMAGAPPSGVQLLETCARDKMPQQLEQTFDEWRRWTAHVLESHLAFPALILFRSSHDNEAWLNSFGAVMDAATLVLTAIDDGPTGPARLMFKVGAHFVEDVGWYYGYHSEELAGIEREEFNEACIALRAAGYTTRHDDDAWDQFRTLRAIYAAPVNRLARFLAIIPAPWIGDRSYLPHSDPSRRRARRSRRLSAGS